MKIQIILVAACLLCAGSLVAQNATKVVAKPDARPAAVQPVMSKSVDPTVPATTQNDANPNAADIKFEVDEHNFGSIKQGEVVNYDFKFTNTGKEPLIIANASGSCGCTVPDWPKDPIKPGASGVIKVSFNSSGKSGMQDKTVTITSNSKTPTKVIHVKGVIIDPNAGAPAPKADPAPAKKN